MSLKSSNKVETNRYQLEIEVDAKTFEDAVNQAYRKEIKKIQIPGFRKGKAPRAFVEKYYGEQVFYEDAINAVYPSALDGAVEEAGLEMIEDKIDFDLVSAGKDGLVFKATITTKPEVELSAYKGLEATKKNTEVTQEDIDEDLKRLQQRNSRMVAVEDRPAQKDDITVIDFEGFVDDVAFEGGKGENYSLTLGSGQFIPGFEDQIIGHNVDDEFDVNVTFPEDYQAKELAGKAAVFKVKLHEIKKRELPEIDDDLIKEVGEFDTLEEYKNHVKEDIAKKKEEAAKDDVENQLIDKLIENLTAEIPEAMYEHRIDDNIRDFAYRLQSQGLNLDTYMKYTGMDMDGFRKSFRPQAERQVKVRLALEKIAQLENIVPVQEEIDAEYDKMAKAYNMTVEQIKPMVAEKDLAKDLAVEKAINLVRDSAKVTEEKAEEKPAAKPRAKKKAKEEEKTEE